MAWHHFTCVCVCSLYISPWVTCVIFQTRSLIISFAVCTCWLWKLPENLFEKRTQKFLQTHPFHRNESLHQGCFQNCLNINWPQTNHMFLCELHTKNRNKLAYLLMAFTSLFAAIVQGEFYRSLATDIYGFIYWISVTAWLCTFHTVSRVKEGLVLLDYIYSWVPLTLQRTYAGLFMKQLQLTAEDHKMLFWEVS